MGLIYEDDTEGRLLQNDPEENVSNYGSSVGWVTDSNAVTNGWDSDSSTVYVLMLVRRKQEEELKIAEAKSALRINGHATQAWLDSGLPISIFAIGELKHTLGTCNVRLQLLDPNDDQFRDYGNNPLKFMGKMVIKLQSNGWTTNATINVIGGCRPSIIDQGLMPELGLTLFKRQRSRGCIQRQSDTAEQGEDLDDWQRHLNKQFHHLFLHGRAHS